jgi:hypothetical protein
MPQRKATRLRGACRSTELAFQARRLARAAPADFAAADHDDSNWVDIRVPGTW